MVGDETLGALGQMKHRVSSAAGMKGGGGCLGGGDGVGVLRWLGMRAPGQVWH